MRIAIGSDHRGVEMRAKLANLLQRMEHEVIDVGAEEGEAVGCVEDWMCSGFAQRFFCRPNAEEPIE